MFFVQIKKRFQTLVLYKCRLSDREGVLIIMSLSSDDLALKLEWYEIRDLLLGHNEKQQDVKRALELASTCRHPDAQWLTGVCAGKNVKTREDAKAGFLAQGNEDALAMCFAALVDEDDVDRDLLRRSAEMGFALAQAWMSFYVSGLECFTFASGATAQGERDGFCWLGYCFKYADGCEKDLEKAKENYLLAAKMDMLLRCISMASCLLSLIRSAGTGGALLRLEDLLGIF